MLIQGRVSGLVFLIITVATMLFAISKSKNKLPKVRKIAGLEAITEAVGRATEMGKAVFCTPGWADITSGSAGATFAAIDIIAHVARLTAKYDTRIVVAVSYPNVYPLVEQTVQQAYLAEGKPEAYDPDMVRFTSPEQYAYAAACLGMIQREKVATAIFVGQFASEAVDFAEAAVAVNAIGIAGTTSTYQLPFFAAACDYTLIGEELLAAGAYISGDTARLGSIQGQDYVKAFALAVLLIGVIIRTAGNDLVARILTQ
ncbi:MAG: DUF6754 domain-containing protein [Bacillota bacterium]